jgi:hypothetical protein
MGIKIEVTQPDGGTEVHDGDDERDTPDAAEPEKPEADADPAPEAEAAPDEEPADEVTVSIGDEAPPPDETERAPEWVRELRKQHRELQKKVRDYEAREQIAPAAPKPVVGPKPKLEDHDYDTDKYETALESWYRSKEQADKAERESQRQAEEAQKAWQAKLDGYGKAKADLKVRDFDDAEHTVYQALNVTQQGILLDALDNPALMVVALGKNPKELARLAAIQKPTQFLRELSRIEDTKLKVTPRTKPPAPERSLPAGTAPVSGGSDTTLERLREEAARTGDMTKVVAYKRQLAAKASARA